MLDNSSLKIDTTPIDIVQVIMDIVISNYALIKNNEIEINNKVPEKQVKIYGRRNYLAKNQIQIILSFSSKTSLSQQFSFWDRYDSKIYSIL